MVISLEGGGERKRESDREREIERFAWMRPHGCGGVLLIHIIQVYCMYTIPGEISAWLGIIAKDKWSARCELDTAVTGGHHRAGRERG